MGRVGRVEGRVDSALIPRSKRILYYGLDPMSKSIRKAGGSGGLSPRMPEVFHKVLLKINEKITILCQFLMKMLPFQFILNKSPIFRENFGKYLELCIWRGWVRVAKPPPPGHRRIFKIFL